MRSLLLASLLLALAAPAEAGPRGPHGGGPRADHAYDVRTVRTVAGELQDVERVSGRGAAEGVHVTILTGTALTPVYVGPSWFLEERGLHLAKGDEVVIVGSLVDVGGTSTLIAAEVRKGDQVVSLRDEAGVPRWSGRRAPGS